MFTAQRRTIALLLLMVPAISGCRRFAASAGVSYVPFTTVEADRPLSTEVTHLNLDIRAGTLRVVAGTEGALHVKGQVHIKESLNNPDLARGSFADHVRVTIEGNTLTVSDAHTDQPDERDWRVSLVVTAPPGINVNLHSGAGRIVVENMSGDIKTNTAAGEVIVRSATAGAVTVSTGAGKAEIVVDTVTGPVTVSTRAGAIELTVAKSPPTRNVYLSTAVGDIKLAIPPDSPGTYYLKTDVGRVAVQGHRGLQSKRSGVGAVVRGTIGSGGPTYKIHATAGSIELNTPDPSKPDETDH